MPWINCYSYFDNGKTFDFFLNWYIPNPDLIRHPLVYWPMRSLDLKNFGVWAPKTPFSPYDLKSLEFSEHSSNKSSWLTSWWNLLPWYISCGPQTAFISCQIWSRYDLYLWPFSLNFQSWSTLRNVRHVHRRNFWLLQNHAWYILMDFSAHILSYHDLDWIPSNPKV